MCQPCPTPMYINTIQYTIIYHEWSVSTICQEHVPTMYQPYVCTNIPTMFLKQVSYHSWYASTMNQVPQPCISTINISTKHHKKCLNYIIPYIMYQIKCIIHTPNLNKMNHNKDVFPYMSVISTINHVLVILLASASKHILRVFVNRSVIYLYLASHHHDITHRQGAIKSLRT
jgi:hypothetical protein